jgi:hypothetical protein
MSVADLIELVMQTLKLETNRFVFSKDFVLGKSNSDSYTSEMLKDIVQQLAYFSTVLDSVEQRGEIDLVGTDGSDLSLTDKLKSLTGM